LECKNCTAELPLTLSGKYAGLCEACASLKAKQDERDANRRSDYEATLAFASAAALILVGLGVMACEGGGRVYGPAIFVGLIMVLGPLITGFLIFLAGAAAACYGVHLKRGGEIIRWK